MVFNVFQKEIFLSQTVEGTGNPNMLAVVSHVSDPKRLAVALAQ